MLNKVPDSEELKQIMGENVFEKWNEINNFIMRNYDMETIWDEGGKTGIYELKYRKSGKTLCALYPREKGLCILIIFGKNEREKFEALKDEFSESLCELYNKAHQYHDGKWLYIDLTKNIANEDIKRLLQIKKKPNKQN